MKTNSKLVFAFAFLIIFSPQKQEAADTTDYSHYLDQFVDTSANPSENFFQYAVGKWLKNNPIPSNENSWGIFNVVPDETYQRLLTINKQATDSHAEQGTNQQKIGDFWYTGMDTDKIEKVGITPLQAEFDRIQSISSKRNSWMT